MMDFLEVQAVFRHFSEAVHCPRCNALFDIKKIKILVAIKEQGLASYLCEKCKTHVFINFALSKVDLKEQKKATSVQLKKTMTISTNDVLDMHNFLKSFEGDLKNILT